MLHAARVTNCLGLLLDWYGLPTPFRCTIDVEVINEKTFRWPAFWIVLWPWQNPKSPFSYLFTALFKLVKTCKNRCPSFGTWPLFLARLQRLALKLVAAGEESARAVASEAADRWSPTDPQAGDPGVITDQLIQLGTKSHRGHHCPTGPEDLWILYWIQRLVGFTP